MPRLLRSVLVPAALLSVSLLSGCGASGDTPRAAFEEARAAVESQDWAGYCARLTPESRRIVASESLVICALASIEDDQEIDAANEKELDDLLLKHGVDPNAKGGVLQAFDKVLQPLADAGPLAADLLDYAHRHIGKTGLMVPVRLDDVDVDGSRATGEAVFRLDTPFGAQEGDADPARLRFRLQEDRWLLDLTAEED